MLSSTLQGSQALQDAMQRALAQRQQVEPVEPVAKRPRTDVTATT